MHIQYILMLPHGFSFPFLIIHTYLSTDVCLHLRMFAFFLLYECK